MSSEERKEDLKQDASQEKQDKKDENVEQTSQEVVLSQEEFDGIKTQMAKILNDYKELEKDFEHYRKRTKESEIAFKTEGMTKALETILPCLDSFKKAKKMIKDEVVLEGVNMIEKNIISALEKLGVKKIDCVGKKFDADKHNAVLMVEDKKNKSGTVVEEIEAGYTLNGNIIKYSQVVVAK